MGWIVTGLIPQHGCGHGMVVHNRPLVPPYLVPKMLRYVPLLIDPFHSFGSLYNFMHTILSFHFKLEWRPQQATTNVAGGRQYNVLAISTLTNNMYLFGGYFRLILLRTVSAN
jgi:hypothetical protein